MGIGEPPPRTPDTFTFSQQLRHQLGNLALVAIEPLAPWERVADLQFARRPGEAALWHLLVEIQGNYSNVVLTNQDNIIVTAAHQVSSQQSSVRPIQTGQTYEAPPHPAGRTPSLDEGFDRWQERLSLIPDPLRRALIKTYRGLSSALVLSMLQAAELSPDQTTDTLTSKEWARLFDRWQTWLKTLNAEEFQPGWLAQGGYTVLGWGAVRPAESVQQMIDRYYTDQLNHQEFTQLRHQISQRLANLLKKLSQKAQGFRDRLQQSGEADDYREKADLLMAHLHEWQPGMKQIQLADFETGQPVKIPLDPEKNAVQNAQALYKRHQKLKRSKDAIEPLLADVEAEINYLEQVEVGINQVDRYRTSDDLDSLEEIREELIQQGYLEDPEQKYRSSASNANQTNFLRYRTPNQFEVLIGRNNRQNDLLTFRTANDYDLWFHTQEIPGSHVLLRLDPGAVPDEVDLQFTADLAAYYSRARQSDQAPVVYTEPKQVFKPKGAKPGIAIYKQERIIWGQPQKGRSIVESAEAL